MSNLQGAHGGGTLETTPSPLAFLQVKKKSYRYEWEEPKFRRESSFTNLGMIKENCNLCSINYKL